MLFAQESRRARRRRPPRTKTIIPTYETQKQARTYVLDIPAPRGQIVDRNGVPLAQNKLSYNLAFNYPTPLEFSDAAGARLCARENRRRRRSCSADR